MTWQGRIQVPDGELHEELERLYCSEEGERGRQYPSYWHATNLTQAIMENHATQSWALEVNSRGWGIDLPSIVKVEGDFPDCIAGANGLRIGVEVTELTVNEDERREFIEGRRQNLQRVFLAPGVEWSHQVERSLDACEPNMPFGETADWPFEKFQGKFLEILQRKEHSAHSHADKGILRYLDKLILLIVTDEPNLWKERLRGYMDDLRLPKSNAFSHVFIMMAPDPSAVSGESRFPLFGALFES